MVINSGMGQGHQYSYFWIFVDVSFEKKIIGLKKLWNELIAYFFR
jgi:hypothetical protein